MATNFTQDFFTSRNNRPDGSTRIGHRDRLWYDPLTNTIRVGDGNPGGRIVIGGDGSTTIPGDGTIFYDVDDQISSILIGTATTTFVRNIQGDIESVVKENYTQTFIRDGNDRITGWTIT